MGNFDFDSLIKKIKPLADEYKRVSLQLQSPEFSADKTYYLHLMKTCNKLERINALYDELTALESADENDVLNNVENAKINDVSTQIILELSSLGDGAVTNAIMTINGDKQCKTAYLTVVCDNLAKNRFEYRIDGNSLFATGFGVCGLLNEFAGTITLKGSVKGKIEAFVFPETTQEKFDEKDVEISLFRSDGAGGQNVNKVETGVRATHLPSGLTVTCRDERSQLQNKKKAIDALEKKYYSLQEKNNIAEREKLKAEQRKIVKTITL